MLRDLTPPQRRLADYMSKLSEEAYGASWMAGLEYALWELLAGERNEYGRLVFTDQHRTRIRQLSDDCGGWIVFDDETEETWLEVGDWQARLAHRNDVPAKGGG
ncbi:MAG TPA: hypothetical protein PLB02_03835 [Thermoanaerobaculia bacterium]|nr:hypothetical protein [Thermoanaerobaculia bacterium]HQR66503.1 hypothetical protein [Thermoanaerobaculia bacterium]